MQYQFVIFVKTPFIAVNGNTKNDQPKAKVNTEI